VQDVASKVRAVAADLGRRLGTQLERRAALERIARESIYSLQLAARALERQHQDDKRALELLGETCREIAGNAHGLLHELLEDLVGEAERSAAGDQVGLLRRLRDDLATMDSD
jgi:hypothetical protein